MRSSCGRSWSWTLPERDPVAAVEDSFRRESRRAFATVARVLGDLSLADDAVQEAFAIALAVWPERGVPDNPGAWITTTARNRALDRVRREALRAGKERAASPGDVARPADHAEIQPVPDDQLRLLFACCHPSLTVESRVALTLRLVCDLRTVEIARVFLQAEATVAQRIARAKRKIRDAGIPLRIPEERLLPERLPSVLACIYLLFTEGYAATQGRGLLREDLCDEACRLATLVVELLPEEPEARGLLALVLLQDARREARTLHGRVISLEAQDRSQWNRRRIAEGAGQLERALAHGRPGPFQVQAAIAALHALAPSWEATDWEQIAALYAHLARIAPSPVVELNRAVATGFAAGPDSGLAVLAGVADDPRLSRTHLVAATRADLLCRLGRAKEAADAYREALALVRTEPERRFLQARLETVKDGIGPRRPRRTLPGGRKPLRPGPGG